MLVSGGVVRLCVGVQTIFQNPYGLPSTAQLPPEVHPTAFINAEATTGGVIPLYSALDLISYRIYMYELHAVMHSFSLLLVHPRSLGPGTPFLKCMKAW